MDNKMLASGTTKPLDQKKQEVAELPSIQQALENNNIPTIEIANLHLNRYSKNHRLFKQAKEFMTAISDIALKSSHKQLDLFKNNLSYESKLIPKILNKNKITNYVKENITSYLTNSEFSQLSSTNHTMNKICSNHPKYLKSLSKVIEQGFYLQDTLDQFQDQESKSNAIEIKIRMNDLITSLKKKGISNFKTIYSRFKKLNEINQVTTLNEAQLIALSGNYIATEEWIKTNKNYMLDLNGGHIVHYITLTGNPDYIKLIDTYKLDTSIRDLHGNGMQHYAIFSGNAALKEYIKILKLYDDKNYQGITAKQFKKISSSSKLKVQHTELHLQTINQTRGLIFDGKLTSEYCTLAVNHNYRPIYYIAKNGNPFLFFLCELIGYNELNNFYIFHNFQEKLSDNPAMNALIQLTDLSEQAKLSSSDLVAWEELKSLPLEERAITFIVNKINLSTNQAVANLKNYLLPPSNLLSRYFQLNHCLIHLMVNNKLESDSGLINRLLFVKHIILRIIQRDNHCVMHFENEEKSLSPRLYYERIAPEYKNRTIEAIEHLPNFQRDNLQNIAFIINNPTIAIAYRNILQLLERKKLSNDTTLKKIRSHTDHVDDLDLIIYFFASTKPCALTKDRLEWVFNNIQHTKVIRDMLSYLSFKNLLDYETLDLFLCNRENLQSFYSFLYWLNLIEIKTPTTRMIITFLNLSHDVTTPVIHLITNLINWRIKLTEKDINWILDHAQYIDQINSMIYRLAIFKKFNQDSYSHLVETFDIEKNKMSNMDDIDQILSIFINQDSEIIPPNDIINWITNEIEHLKPFMLIISELANRKALTFETLKSVSTNHEKISAYCNALDYLKSVRLLTETNKNKLYNHIHVMKELSLTLFVMASLKPSLLTQNNFDLLLSVIEHLDEISASIYCADYHEKKGTLTQSLYLEILKPYLDLQYATKKRDLLGSWMNKNKDILETKKSRNIVEVIAQYDGMKP